MQSRLPSNPALIRGLGEGCKPALIISECQNIVIDPGMALLPDLAAAVESRDMLRKISTLAESCRAIGVPVIFCTVVIDTDPEPFRSTCKLTALMRRTPGFRNGHPAAAIHPALAPQPGDIIAQRSQGVSPFFGDTLETVLQSLAADTLILTGVSTNIALAGLSVDAVNRGLTVILVDDCTAGVPQPVHQMMIAHFYSLLTTVTDAAAVTAALAAWPRSESPTSHADVGSRGAIACYQSQ